MAGKARWLPVAFGVAAAVLSLWALSVPGGYFGVAMWGLVLWVVAAAATAIIGTVAVIALPPPRLRSSVRLWPLVLVPALFVLTTVAGRYAERAVFDLHRSALESLVADVADLPHRRATDRMVGIYPVSATSAEQGCTMISLEGAGFLSASTGFAHCPGGRPRDAGGDGYRFTPIDGPWYQFDFSW